MNGLKDFDDQVARYRAPALDKGLDILEVLAREPGGLTRAEIVKMMGRGPSEIYRMLERLVARQYVARLNGDRYTLSMKLFLLAHRHPPYRRLVAQAQPLMDVFANETRQSCHLVLPDRGQAVVVAQASPTYYWEFRVRIGAELDLFSSSSGLVLLAFQHPEKRAETLATWGISDAESRLASLSQQLDAIRKAGFRQGPSQQLVGIIDLSVPILGPDGNASAILTCPHIEHPNDDLSHRREICLAAMQSLAKELSFSR